MLPQTITSPPRLQAAEHVHPVLLYTSWVQRAPGGIKGPPAVVMEPELSEAWRSFQRTRLVPSSPPVAAGFLKGAALIYNQSCF